MQTIVELNYYASRAEKLLTEAERKEVVDIIASAPLVGDVIQGTGGVRKIRFAKGNKGKSGGVRVIYYYYNEESPILMLDIFGKNEKDNLTKEERNSLAKVVAILKKGLQNG